MSAPNAFLAASKPVRIARSSARSTNSAYVSPFLPKRPAISLTWTAQTSWMAASSLSE